MRPNFANIGTLILFAILALAFISSFMILSRFTDAYHVVVELIKDPQSYTHLASQIALYGVIPIFACLGFSIISYLIENKFPSDTSLSVPFFVFALPCIMWGAIYLITTSNSYSGSLEISNSQYNGNANNSLPPLYQLAGATGLLWLCTGILLIILARKMEKI